MGRFTPDPDPRPRDLREALARTALRVAILRQWWALWPPVIAAEMLAGGTLLHLVWRALALPLAVVVVALVAAAAFGTAATLDRRAGWPRTLAGGAYAAVIGWTGAVWVWGPSAGMVAALGWALVASWPLWLWHRWWRDRERFVQVSESRWERRSGAPTARFDRLSTAARRIRKAWTRSRNRKRWRARQAAPTRVRARARALEALRTPFR